MSLKLSVIIPHYNQPSALRACLASLCARDGSAGEAEIIVVDNGSASLPLDVCRGFPDVALLVELARGPGPARNLGASLATGDVLCFIDADCIAGPGWLAAVRRAFEGDPRATILGGDVRIPRERLPLSQVAAYESVFAYRMDKYIARQGFTGTGNLAVRREVFARVGPFCGVERAEDRDWGQRASAMGYAIRFVPEMIAYHPARETFDELALKWDRHIAHDYADSARTLRGRLRWLLRVGLVAASSAVSAAEVVTTPRLCGIGERRAALACLWRIRLYRAWRMVRIAVARDPLANARTWGQPRANP